MSKTERRKLFQPIPLSSILVPTYQSPFSKLEQFQLDMDVSNLNGKVQKTVWQKLQSTLLNAMSNFIVMSNPVFASSKTTATAQSMSLVPWKAFKPCEILLSEEFGQSSTLTSDPAQLSNSEPKSLLQKSTSLYHSLRGGLQCLRYLATHPVQSEDDRIPLQETQTPTRHYFNCRKQNTSIPANLGYTYIGGGGATFSNLLSDTDLSSRLSLSAPVSPVRHCHQPPSNLVFSNLFSWAMSGLLTTTPLHHRHLNALYKNYFLLSPVHAKGATAVLSPPKSIGGSESAPPSPRANNLEGSIEIIIHATPVTSQVDKNSKTTSSKGVTPSIEIPIAASPKRSCLSAGGNSSSSCIRVLESNWNSRNRDATSNRAKYHTVSVCSSSSNVKGGTLKFSCSSTMSSSPRAMATSSGATGRGRHTESESSADSFVEFSASVDSTDSFCIVFESTPGDCIDEDGIDRNDDDEEWEDDDDDEEDSDEDGEDNVLHYSSSFSDDIFVDGYIFQADGLDDDIPTNSSDLMDLPLTNGQPAKKRKAKTVRTKYTLH